MIARVKKIIESNGFLKRKYSNYVGNKVAKLQLEEFQQIVENLRRFKDIHKGQRCFIIGTGPSLTVEDLEKLKGEICFGSNRIFEIYPKTDWRPTYYMNQDLKLIEKYTNEIAALKADAKFLPVDAIKYFEESTDIDYFILKHKEFFPNKAEFSVDLCRFLGQGFTVTYGAIQMAYWMGFSEVYLLGIDHNYSISLDEKGRPVFKKGTKDYFEGSKASNKDLNLPRIAESTLAYYTAQDFVSKHEVFNVFNATRGGKLEAFPRVDLDEIIRKSC